MNACHHQRLHLTRRLWTVHLRARLDTWYFWASCCVANLAVVAEGIAISRHSHRVIVRLVVGLVDLAAFLDRAGAGFFDTSPRMAAIYVAVGLKGLDVNDERCFVAALVASDLNF